MSLHQLLLLVLGAAMLARVGAMFTRERVLSGFGHYKEEVE